MEMNAKIQKAGKELGSVPGAAADAAKSVGERLFGVGKKGGSAVGGLAGGALGFVGDVVGTAGTIVAKTAKMGLGFIEKFPLLSAAVGGVAVYKAAKGWMKDRDTKQQIATETKRGELIAATTENEKLQGQLGGKPTVDMGENPDVSTNNAARVSAGRQAVAAQGATR